MEISDKICSLRSRRALFCEETLWFEEQVHWRRHYQDARVSIWQNFCGLCRKGFPTDNRHSPNCAPLLADIQSLLSNGRKRLASQFYFTYRYIDDVLSINKPDCENYLGQMYPHELENNDTTESNTSAAYLDLLLSIGKDGQLHTSLYEKRDDFNSNFTNFPFLCNNVPSLPVYCVLSHNSSDTSGLAPLMNVLFWGRCDFPISFSGRDMSQ